MLVVNTYMKISPCCSPQCRNTVSFEDQRHFFGFGVVVFLSLSTGNDEQPQFVVLHLLHVRSWKIPVQRTKLLAISEASLACDCGQSRVWWKLWDLGRWVLTNCQ